MVLCFTVYLRRLRSLRSEGRSKLSLEAYLATVPTCTNKVARLALPSQLCRAIPLSDRGVRTLPIVGFIAYVNLNLSLWFCCAMRRPANCDYKRQYNVTEMSCFCFRSYRVKCQVPYPTSGTRWCTPRRMLRFQIQYIARTFRLSVELCCASLTAMHAPPPPTHTHI